MLTVPEAARRVGKDPETIRRWIRGGRLRSQRVGTQHLIDETDLDALVSKSDRLPRPPEWETTRSGRPMPDAVALVREVGDSSGRSWSTRPLRSRPCRRQTGSVGGRRGASSAAVPVVGVRSALHVAVWRGVLGDEDAKSANAALDSGPVQERRHPRLGPVAWEIADELGWAKTYDAEYLALASLLAAPIVTLDRRVARAADELSIARHTIG